MALLPKAFGGFERVDIELVPPGQLITYLMQLPVMTSAERRREFVTDL